MLRRASRALILTAIVTVIAYAQCFSDCGLRSCEPEHAQQKPCHQQAPAQKQSACAHQHSDFAAPEARIPNDVSPLLILAEIPWRTTQLLVTATLPPTPSTSPPRSTFVSSPPILRI